MGRPRKDGTPAKKPEPKKVAPVLEHDGEYWYVVSGTKRLNVGRNQRLAERWLAEMTE